MVKDRIPAVVKLPDRIVDWMWTFCSPYSTGSGGEVERHALVSAGPERSEGHQSELVAYADCS